AASVAAATAAVAGRGVAVAPPTTSVATIRATRVVGIAATAAVACGRITDRRAAVGRITRGRAAVVGIAAASAVATMAAVAAIAAVSGAAGRRTAMTLAAIARATASAITAIGVAPVLGDVADAIHGHARNA